MAKTNIIFNDKNYSIDESSLSAATTELRNHLQSVMNGSGATINFGGESYNVDSAKLSTARNDFATHLGTIAGSGKKVVVNGVEYGVGSDKVAGAVSELETVFGNSQSVNKPLFGQRYLSTVMSDGTIYTTFYEDGSVTMDMYDNDICVETQSMPSGTCIYEDGFIYANGQTWTVSPDGLYINLGYGYMVIEGSQQLVVGLYESGAISEYNNAGHKDLGAVVIKDKLIYSWDELQEEGYLYDVNGDLRKTTTTKSLSGDLIMPEHITAIKDYFFQQCESLTGIKSLGSISDLGEGAFDSCSNLVTVDLALENINSIPKHAFARCASLAKFKIPESCTYIGQSAFSNCTNLNNLIFGGTIAQWNVISKQTSWNYNVPATYVQCSDGQVAL